MKEHEFVYYISNGKYAIAYLQELSNTLQGKTECNKAFNHASSVAILVSELQKLYAQNKTLEAKIEECHKVIKELKSGEFNELLAKERSKLQQEFESLRNALTQVILDFPDIDY